jgi:hypothetical protein
LNFVCGVIEPPFANTIRARHLFARRAATVRRYRPPCLSNCFEHFDARHHRLARVAEADDFHFFAYLYLATLTWPVTTVPRP